MIPFPLSCSHQRADGQVDLERVEVVTVKGRVGGSQPTLAVEDEEGHTGLLQWQVGACRCEVKASMHDS